MSLWHPEKLPPKRLTMNWMPDGTKGYVLTAKGAGVNPAYEPVAEATKELWVAGNYTLGSNATREESDFHPVVALPDAVIASVAFGFRVPHDFSSLLSGYPKMILYAPISGDVMLHTYGRAGASGQALGNRYDSITWYTQSIIGEQITEVDISGAFDGLALAPGDQVGVGITRVGADPADTLADKLYVLGILVRYS